MAFGSDGKLYITHGDQFEVDGAQQLSSYRGKILRINKDGSIPTDNPFHDGAGPNRDEIWAYGLRNPFRMSIDRITGTMYIGDVGGNIASTAIEEVNVGTRGANYGWPLCEGNCGIPGVTGAIYEYPHLVVTHRSLVVLSIEGLSFRANIVGIISSEIMSRIRLSD